MRASRGSTCSVSLAKLASVRSAVQSPVQRNPCAIRSRDRETAGLVLRMLWALLVLWAVGCKETKGETKGPPREPDTEVARPVHALTGPSNRVQEGERQGSGAARPARQRPAMAQRRQTLLEFSPKPNDQIMTATIQRVSLAGDTEPELLVAQPLLGQLSWLRGCADGSCDVTVLPGLGQPVRATPVDADGDGDLDVLVADVGAVRATDERVGRVMLLVNDGNFVFMRRQLGRFRRVSCAEPGDFDGDGDPDVLVCEFGLDHGSVSWLERRADATYRLHTIKRGAGATQAVPHDLDADGKLDVVVSMSQDYQQIVAFRNLGGGRFEERVLWRAHPDFGLVGLEAADLDRDGDLDFVVSGGDYSDESYSFDEHGVFWLENTGAFAFTARRLAGLLGAHATRVVDLDGDGDLDVAVASMRVAHQLPEAHRSEAGLWWLENRGRQVFARHPVGNWPAHTLALEVVDFGSGPVWFVGSFTFSVARPGDVRLAALWPR